MTSSLVATIFFHAGRPAGNALCGETNAFSSRCVPLNTTPNTQRPSSPMLTTGDSGAPMSRPLRAVPKTMRALASGSPALSIQIWLSWNLSVSTMPGFISCRRLTEKRLSQT